MTIQELDDPTDDDDVASYRARARNLLSEITRQIRRHSTMPASASTYSDNSIQR